MRILISSRSVFSAPIRYPYRAQPGDKRLIVRTTVARIGGFAPVMKPGQGLKAGRIATSCDSASRARGFEGRARDSHLVGDRSGRLRQPLRRTQGRWFFEGKPYDSPECRARSLAKPPDVTAAVIQRGYRRAACFPRAGPSRLSSHWLRGYAEALCLRRARLGTYGQPCASAAHAFARGRRLVPHAGARGALRALCL